MSIVFSGIQPSGTIHIGNYLGTLKNWVELQHEHDCIFCIADLHAITVDYEPDYLSARSLDVAAILIAIGIDPKKCLLFLQSRVPEHAYLAWIFNTLTPLGELERMTQFKEKSGQYRHNINAGLLTYPILQAADILLYKTTEVPIGEDQRQHLELTRVIARKFNQRFGQTFPEPQERLGKGARVMSLQDPLKKMSKSAGALHYIALADDPETIRKKIQKAVTDSGDEIKSGPDKPAMTNLLTIHSLFSGKDANEIEKEFSGRGYGEYKKALAEDVIAALAQIREKRNELLENKNGLTSILVEGGEKARQIAQKTIEEVRQKTGLRL